MTIMLHFSFIKDTISSLKNFLKNRLEVKDLIKKTLRMNILPTYMIY